MSMKFAEFAPSGTYVMAKYSTHTCNMLHEWAHHHKIPKPLEDEKLHSTIIQSSKTIPNYQDLNQEADGLKVEPRSLAIFPTRFKSLSGEPEGALVIILEAKILEDIHWDLIHSNKANHFRPDYTPHVTISYFCPLSVNVNSLNAPPFSLEISKIIAEPIDIDWMSH